MSMMDRIDILAEYFPLNSLLEQNDIENRVVVQFLVDEGLIDLEDYFFGDELLEDGG
jgi:hypothetical protein